MKRLQSERGGELPVITFGGVSVDLRSGTAKEIESSAIREIEPEVRTLFTKVLEHDPREAAKVLEPYPDEFVVQVLELLNPASALKIPLPSKAISNGCGIRRTRNGPWDA